MRAAEVCEVRVGTKGASRPIKKTAQVAKGHLRFKVVFLSGMRLDGVYKSGWLSPAAGLTARPLVASCSRTRDDQRLAHLE